MELDLKYLYEVFEKYIPYPAEDHEAYHLAMRMLEENKVVLPKIAEGFKIKYRGTIYDDAAIKSNGTIVIHSENGNIYTSFNKCEIQL